MIVTRYGLHWAPGGIAFLVQPQGSQNLISPKLESPFVPHIRPKRLRCPHNFDLTTFVDAPDWINDPLAHAFLPTPKRVGEKARVFHDPDGRYEKLLQDLQRLSSPVEPLARPIWYRPPNESMSRYAVTNLTPMVWTSTEMVHCKHAIHHIGAGEAMQRRVLIVTKELLPIYDGEWIKTELTDISGEPLEAIGAGLIRKEMDGEAS